MSFLRVIGSINGEYDLYKEIIRHSNYSLQTGDFGGFLDCNYLDFTSNKINTKNNKSFMGDKDNNRFFVCKNTKNERVFSRYSSVANIDGRKVMFYNWPDNCLGHYGVHKFENDVEFFFVRGAMSPNSNLVEGLGQTKNSEISLRQCFDMVNMYRKIRPDVVITHACPSRIVELFSDVVNKKIKVNVTEQALDKILSIYKPKIWIFSHLEKKFVLNYENVCFYSLGKGNFLDLHRDGKVDFGWGDDRL